MKTSQSLITLKVESFVEHITTSPEFLTTPSAEDALHALLDIQKKVEEALDAVKGAMKEKMIKEGLTSVHGKTLSVSLSPAGQRFILVEKEKVDPQFLELKLNPAAVEGYLAETGKLPEGVREKSRSYAVRIALNKGSHD